jgi:hypothetical protein
VSLCWVQEGIYGGLCYSHSKFTAPNKVSNIKNWVIDSVFQLNTSRIGKEFFNTTSSNSSNPVVSFFDDIINDVQGEINDKINDVAQDLGLHVSYA